MTETQTRDQLRDLIETIADLRRAVLQSQLLNDLGEFAISIKNAVDRLAPVVVPILRQIVESERFQRSLAVVQNIEAIQLDLRPYKNVTLAEVVDALYDVKPCEYKEILDRKFLPDQAAPVEDSELSKAVNYLILIFKIYMALVALDMAPTPPKAVAYLCDNFFSDNTATVQEAQQSQRLDDERFRSGDKSREKSSESNAETLSV